MIERILEKTIYLRATPAQVWAYLTEPDKLAVWFHRPKAPLTGGSFEMFGADSGDRVIWGEVLLAEPFTRLDYTFTVAPMGGAVSIVRWTLENTPGGTRVSLRHEGLSDATEAFDLILALDAGWDKHLDRMRAALHG
ncbi:Uncharacterized conserved protein YndB, AHSA1/START domain [Jannaschia faecimaris]|uniref:Uncharacterized conserved protein YndB, AHSA1/START domain n=1 Tax=Jannaschia faecimaris TaxID=1244108 RepID=A0A1H3L7H0_9RHOB|nr:SRPBCC domain-containing protein [Jannaschia faecimaris]SDY59874.1 Uncharacterized conserved protein YndB, AHSA1/START domain [Jannaschia faecimaris]